MMVSDTANNAMVEFMKERRDKSFDNLRYLMFNPVPVRNPCLLTLASSIIDDYENVQYIMGPLEHDDIQGNERQLDEVLRKYRFIIDNFHNEVLSIVQYLCMLEEKEYWVLVNLSREYSVSIGDETGRICNLYFTENDKNKHTLCHNSVSNRITFKLYKNDKIDVMRL